MKKIIIILLLISSLYGSIDIQQNIRALYKDVELTEIQENYILDYQDDNIEKLQRTLKKEIRSLKSKYLSEKNIVTFKLSPAGVISKIKFLKPSNNRKLDKATKKAIQKTKFIKPSETTTMRYIISYRVGKSQRNNNYQAQTSNANEIYYIPIKNGTTRFEYSSKEYVRTFETSKDGFINGSVKPSMCADFKLLTMDNQNVRLGYVSWQFNSAIPKGKYKMLIKVKKTCDVSLQYL